MAVVEMAHVLRRRGAGGEGTAAPGPGGGHGGTGGRYQAEARRWPYPPSGRTADCPENAGGARMAKLPASQRDAAWVRVTLPDAVCVFGGGGDEGGQSG